VISGVVTALDEALVQIRIRSSAGRELVTEAVLDTGFNDYLVIRPLDAAPLHVSAPFPAL